MFYKKLNKGLIFALILSIAAPAQAWDVKGFFKNFSFNTLSNNQKTGVIAGVVAVCAALMGYAAWKNLKARAASSAWDEMIHDIEVTQAGKEQDDYEEWRKQKAIAQEQKKQEEDKQQKRDHLGGEKDLDDAEAFHNKNLQRAAFAQLKQAKQQRDKNKQDEVRKKQEEAELAAKKAMEVTPERRQQLLDWWKKMEQQNHYVARVEAQLAKISKLDGTVMVPEGGHIKLAPSTLTTKLAMECDPKDLILISQWCKEYRKKNPAKEKPKKKSFYDKAMQGYTQEPAPTRF